MIDNPELLQKMVKDQEGQKDLYAPGPYWKPYCNRIVKALKRDGLSNFRNNPAVSKGFGDCVVLDPSELLIGGGFKSEIIRFLLQNPFIKKKFLFQYESTIRQNYEAMKQYRDRFYEKEFSDWLDSFFDTKTFPETLAGGSEDFVTIRGRKIATLYLTNLLHIYNFSQKVNFDSVESIFEIGGGFGSNLHLLLHLYPNIKKVLYLDIPPVLYIATQYLRYFYPDAIKDYQDLSSLSEISFSEGDKREILCISPWQLPQVKTSIDLFWNGNSFQEMSEPIIQNYLDEISRLLDKENGKLTLLMYPEKDLTKLTPTQRIKQLFRSHFEIDSLEPLLCGERKSTYFSGSRKTSKKVEV